MTLQQLRFLIAVAESGSINAAAQRLYTAQSNISNAVKSLEQELHIEIFTRSSRGVALTNDGTELLGYARQVVEQADMLEARYEDGGTPQARLAISAQHYAFSVEAFVNVVERCRDSKFEFIMRETTTSQIIDDVRAFRSDIGILYLDDLTPASAEAFADARASFHPLFDATVHVFVSERHPLARRPQLSLADLTPYTRYSFEQGTSNSFYYAEEPFSYIPCDRNIRISDRGTLTNLLITSNGYTLSTGVLSNEMQWGMASIPLADAPTMHVGYIMHNDRKSSPSCSNTSTSSTASSCQLTVGRRGRNRRLLAPAGMALQWSLTRNVPNERKPVKVIIYTDGSARSNPGRGGYGAVLKYTNPAGKTFTSELSRGYAKTTNNRMELMAVIVALEALNRPCEVEVHSDSQYVVNAFNKHWIDGWKKRGWKTANKQPVKNRDLWERLLTAKSKHKVEFIWVKGHAGHELNERCDELATTAADGSNLDIDAGFNESDL